MVSFNRAEMALWAAEQRNVISISDSRRWALEKKVAPHCPLQGVMSVLLQGVLYVLLLCLNSLSDWWDDEMDLQDAQDMAASRLWAKAQLNHCAPVRSDCCSISERLLLSP